MTECQERESLILPKCKGESVIKWARNNRLQLTHNRLRITIASDTIWFSKHVLPKG